MAENSRHKILIIGGGTAGLTVAARLRRAGESDVAIIEPSEQHFYQPLWTLVGAGAVRPEATARAEVDYIAAGATWIKDWACEISPESKYVATRSGARISYDFLIVAPGLELNWEAIAGLHEAVGNGSVSTNYTYENAPQTWDLIRNFKGYRAIPYAADAYKMPGRAAENNVPCGGSFSQEQNLRQRHLWIGHSHDLWSQGVCGGPRNGGSSL